ncbi:MAG: stage 0 sporulation family protein [Oscillospiraceae bacterium]|nr:stage 0 sporulation family protein [Oscillospiraceae bacterium]
MEEFSNQVPAQELAAAAEAAAAEAASAEVAAVTVPELPAPVEQDGAVVVDIRFRSGGKNYFFDPGSLSVKSGDDVIIDTARGPEFGTCVVGNHRAAASEIVAPLRAVLRIATASDQKIAAENREKEKKAFSVCLQKIEEHKLDMQLVSAECAFDGSKILFFFTADGRVDFRELVKNLASVFRTRIELRQIGVRDKAKMVGGLGVCGRPFCCSQFLDDFQPVSIKMAKTQNLSLNPAKISGTCGRLMCCLKYEQEAYEDLIKTAPKSESFVDTPDGRGTVIDVSLLRQSVRVRMENQPDTIGSYKNCDICVLRNGKAKKDDPPIPRDLAPISSQKKPPKPAEEEAMPLLEPIIFHSEAAATPVPVPDFEETETVETAEAAPRERSRRRRKKSGGDPAAQSAEKPELPAIPPAAAAESSADPKQKSSSTHRRYRRRKPKSPNSTASE